ncbi:MAG: LPS export ABC transporter periplasmic protein LptC [Bacteroidetes bacterium]|nr:LPS export ABC transporter periplasmic protein LptC [Bacteroidota bacterium]
MNKRHGTYHILHHARILIPGLLLGIAACHNDPKEIASLTEARTAYQLDKADDVTLIYSEHGHVKAKVFAKQYISNDAAKPPYMDMKNGIKAEVYDDSMHVESTLTANYARYYVKQGNFLIRDNIVVVNKKGETLNTEELVWNQQVQKFYTEKFVKISTPTLVMYGDGLEANQDFTWYRITNQKGTMLVNKSEVPSGN